MLKSFCLTLASLLVLSILVRPTLEKSVKIGVMISKENEWKFKSNVVEGYTRAYNHSSNGTIADYDLVYIVINTCDGMSGTRAAMQLYLNTTVNVIFGSFCSANCVQSAQVADYWNVPYFALECIDPALDNSTLYTTAIRLTGSLNAYGLVLTAFFQRNNWKSCAIVKEVEVDFCQYVMNAVRNKFRAKINISEFLEVGNALSDEEVNNLLDKIDNSARIILVCHTNPSTMLKVLNFAYQRGMTDASKYAWVSLYNIYSNFSFNTLFIPWMIANGTEQMDAAKKAFLAVKSLTFKNYTRLMDPGANLTHNVTSKTLQLDIMTDSIFLFFSLMEKAYESNLDPLSGRNILNLSRSRELSGGVTETIKMNDDGDRFMSFTVWSLAPDSATFRPFLNFNFTDSDYTPFLASTENWGYGNIPPPDRPACGFDYKLCLRDDKSLIIGLVVMFLLLIFILVVSMVIRSQNNEQKIQSMTWKIKYSDLHFLKKPSSLKSLSQSSDLNESDEHFFLDSFKEFEKSNIGGVLIAIHKGDVVTVNYSAKKEIMLTRKELVELVKMKELQHDNIVYFLGACVEPDRICYLTQYCARGSLQDLLADQQIAVDWTFKLSFITDLTKGMNYLHKSFVEQHGRLNSGVCMVDNRWVLKVAGFGLSMFKLDVKEDEPSESYYRKLLWTAPEHLLSSSSSSSQKGDVYSFAIVVHEILYRSFPYYDTNLEYKDIITRIYNCQNESFRPRLHPLDDSDANSSILNLVTECWAEDSADRPTFDAIEKTVKKFYTGKTDSIVDSMLKKLEKYASNLELVVEQRNKELIDEKNKTDVLLNSMLPPFIADELKAGHKVEPQMYQSVTVYFSDIVGFTTLSSDSTPMQIVDLLNDLYGVFDDTISRHNVYKVETIGDSYMVVSGLPQVTERHVVEICNMALDLLGIVKTFKIRHRPEMTLMLRIGIHSGPCAAGVVGHTMPRYCLFGDTVNTASRMESTALKIHLSTPAKDQLSRFPGYVMELRGPTELKGKGTMVTYWLLRKDSVDDTEEVAA